MSQRSRTTIVNAALAFLFLIAPAGAARAKSEGKLDAKEWSRTLKEFEAAFASDNADAMCAAVKALGADQSRRAVDKLVQIALLDRIENIRVYEAVRDALGAIAEPEAVAYMIESLEKKDEPRHWPLRCVIVDALASVPGPEATRALGARLSDKVGYVISAAAKSLGKRKDPAGVDALIAALAELEKRKDVTWIDVRAALTAITGHDYQTAKEWEGFWGAKRGSFDPEKDRGSKEGATTVERESPKFFTEPIVSKRIMFILDVSGSMDWADIPVETKGRMKRIDIAKNELMATIRELPSDVKFNVIAFSTGLKAWRPSRQGLQLATPEARASAVQWVSALVAEGATHTDEALKEAFANADVNTIVLFSDGSPTRALKTGGMDPISEEKILDQVKAWNRLRNVRIHTFCFKAFEDGSIKPQPQYLFDPAKCLKFLEELASQNGGKLTKG